MKSIAIGIMTLLLTMTIAEISILSQQQSEASLSFIPFLKTRATKAPMVTSDDNVYVTWWTNKSGNWEVMFRASNDNGVTFGDKINLSNTTDTDSENAEIAASGENVYVSWWENSLQNGTSKSVLRVSTDNGATFGPVLMLGTNGTIGEVQGGE